MNEQDPPGPPVRTDGPLPKHYLTFETARIIDHRGVAAQEPSTPDAAMPLCIIRLDDHISPLLAELVIAACAWYCTIGIDKDYRLRNAAKAVYEARQRT